MITAQRSVGKVVLFYQPPRSDKEGNPSSALSTKYIFYILHITSSVLVLAREYRTRAPIQYFNRSNIPHLLELLRVSRELLLQVLHGVCAAASVQRGGSRKRQQNGTLVDENQMTVPSATTTTRPRSTQNDSDTVTWWRGGAMSVVWGGWWRCALLLVAVLQDSWRCLLLR